MAKRLTRWMLAAMVPGVLSGSLLNRTVTDPATLATLAGGPSILANPFPRPIGTIVAPPVLATLATFRIAARGLVPILAVDHFSVMGRTATDVVVAQWKGAQ